MEDMIGDPDNVSKYGSFNETCSSGIKVHLIFTQE